MLYSLEKTVLLMIWIIYLHKNNEMTPKLTLIEVSYQSRKLLTSGDNVFRHRSGAQGHCLLIVVLRRRCCRQRGRRIARAWSCGIGAILQWETYKT